MCEILKKQPLAPQIFRYRPKPNPLIPKTTSDIKILRWSTIEAEEEGGRTSKKFVYAGGDIVTGAARRSFWQWEPVRLPHGVLLRIYKYL